MWTKFLIVLLSILYRALWLYRLILWPYEKVFKFIYECFAHVRTTYTKDMNWCQIKLWELKSKDA